MTIFLTIIAAILVFGVVIFIHELGHFFVAKQCNIKVNEFAIGMGPQIFKFVRGETTYAIRLLPIGGFVSMEGEDEESDDSRSFTKAKLWKRVLVIIAGAFMNIVLGFFVSLCQVAFGNGGSFTGISFAEAPIWVFVLFGLLAAALATVIFLAITKKLHGKSIGLSIAGILLAAFILTISFGGKGKMASRIVGPFVDGAVTQQTGLQEGDEIIKVNGRSCFVLDDIAYEFSRTQSPVFDLVVKRDGKKVELNGVTFDTTEKSDGDTSYTVLVLDFYIQGVEKNFFTVNQQAFNTTIYYARTVYTGLYDLITGNVAITQMSGPVGIVNEVSKAVQNNWYQVFSFMALISINLGIVNMLPLPALDGGKALLLIIEAIRRKPIKQKYEIIINLVGLGLLLILMIFITFNDVVRIFFS